MTASELIGQKFGRLTIVSVIGWIGANRKLQCECECGKVTTPYLHSLRSGRVKSCGCWKREIVSRVCSAKIGDKHHNWRGGRRIVGGGYVRVMMRDHPRASRGYVLEHVLVIEKNIGRELLACETVHHINGVRSDNRPENLELWDSNHCSGQRHIEKMAFHTQEIIAKASNEELVVIHSAIVNRMESRGVTL